MSVPTGQVAFSDLQTEHGGTNPISISEYYRGGSNVPSTETTPAGSYDAYAGNTNQTWDVGGAVAADLIYGGSTIASGDLVTNTGLINDTTFSTGGHDYQRTTTSWGTKTTGSGKNEVNYQRYPVRRRTSEFTTNINTSVPSSGQIGISSLRGSESP